MKHFILKAYFFMNYNLIENFLQKHSIRTESTGGRSLPPSATRYSNLCNMWGPGGDLMKAPHNTDACGDLP